MQHTIRLSDALVAFGLCLFFCTGGGSGPLWGMLLQGLAGLALMALGAHYGGYILGSQRWAARQAGKEDV